MKIDHRPYGRHSDVSYPDYRCFQICCKETWIGSVLLDLDTAKSLLGTTGALYEFILLSRFSPQGNGAWLVTTRNDSMVDNNDDRYLAWDLEVDDESNDIAYNVMLIERRDGIAYRAALGQVHKAGWDLAGPVRKEMELG